MGVEFLALDHAACAIAKFAGPPHGDFFKDGQPGIVANPLPPQIRSYSTTYRTTFSNHLTLKGFEVYVGKRRIPPRII